MTNAIQLERLGRCADAAGGNPPDGPPPMPGTSERSQRATAQARYQAFAAGAGRTTPRLCTGCAIRPSSPSTPTANGLEAIKNAVLFLRETGDASSIDRNDIHQGQLWDCYFLSALAGVASSPEGRALIQRSIRENRNDQGQVASYTVTLHRPAYNLWGLLPSRFTDVQLTVDASFVPGHAQPSQEGGVKEIWPLVMEKAYAQYLGGDHTLDDRGGRASGALEVLTGRPATSVGVGRYSAQQLESDVRAGRIVALDTIGPKADFQVGDGNAKVTLRGGHSYLVTGVHWDGDELKVDLFNPWNRDSIQTVSYDTLKPCLDLANIGTVR